MYCPGIFMAIVVLINRDVIRCGWTSFAFKHQFIVLIPTSLYGIAQ